MTDPCTKEKEINKILNAIDGVDNQPGIKIQIALILQKIEDWPTPNQLRFHASIGGGVSILLALAGVILFRVITGA